jgi:hypothetical protein
MAIAKFKPGAKPSVEPNLPKLAPKEYKSPVRDEKVVPVNKLVAYVSGTEWSTNYYSQLTAKSNDLREVDPGEHPVYQQYTLINNYSIRVTQAIESTYDTTTGISKVSGSGTLFSFIIPNVNDYFTSDAGEARTGLFKITNVDRKTFNSESVYDVTYELIGYVDTGASASLFNDLSSKVVRHYYFDLNRFKDGLYPLVLDETRRKLIDYNIAYKDMLRYYFAKFFNRNYMTLVLPGQDEVIYDAYLVNYLTKIVEVDLVPELKELRTYTTENDIYIKQDQFWSMMLNRDISILDYMNQKMGIVSKAQFNTNGYLHGFKYSSLEYLVYPLQLEGDNNVDTSCNIRLGPKVKFSYKRFNELRVTNNGLGIAHGTIGDIYSDGNSARVVAYPVGSEDYYVMSGAFYRSEDSMSVMEVLAKDYIKGNSIDSGMLDRVIEDYYKWSRVEQYYYGAVLLTVIKDVVRSSKI